MSDPYRAARPPRHRFDTAGTSVERRYPDGTMTEGCDTGVCGADAPPLVGSILTGTGLTLAQAVALVRLGEHPALSDVQRRIVEAAAEREA
jgi:hypothetical protein